MTTGRKDDTGKLRWGLLRKSCVNALEGVIRVLMFGAKKYGDDNWKDVADAQRRYRDALDRHLADLDRGVEFDPDTGEDNWAHVATNAIFVLQLREEQRAKKGQTEQQAQQVAGIYRSVDLEAGALGPRIYKPAPGRAPKAHWPACEKPINLPAYTVVDYTTRCGNRGSVRLDALIWGRNPFNRDAEIVEWKVSE